MTHDSRRGPLPLAEAIIAWSEPTLIEAIRAAEAQFRPDQLSAWGRPSLATMTTRRANPHRLVVPRLEFAELDRAWETLFADWRYRLERGEVLLEGTDTLAFQYGSASPIPRRRAAELLFDPAAGSVRLGITTYVGVSATLLVQEAARSTDESGSALRELSLPDALLEWGNPVFVQLYKSSKARMLELQMAVVPSIEAQARLAGPRHRPTNRWAEIERLKQGATNLRNGLISDVRQKIERGELSIMGVMTFPSRGTEREPIPRLWASDFFFDVDAGRVHVVQFGRTSHVFVAVVIAGLAKPETPSKLAAGPQREGAVSCSEKDSDKAASGSGDAAKPGAEVESSDREDFASEVPTGNKRRRFPRAELIAIACDRLQARKRLNKEEAHCLLAEFERLHPGRRPPAFREVLDHLRVIYDEAAKARAPRFPPDEE